jgi:hypothetical protein
MSRALWIRKNAAEERDATNKRKGITNVVARSAIIMVDHIHLTELAQASITAAALIAVSRALRPVCTREQGARPVDEF